MKIEECVITIDEVQQSQGLRIWYSIKDKEGKVISVDGYMYLPDVDLKSSNEIPAILDMVRKEASFVLKQQQFNREKYKDIMGVDLVIGDI